MMTKETARNADWYQLVVIDNQGLTGNSVVKFLGPLIRKLGASAVRISDLEGAVPDLKDYEGRIILVDEFLRKAAGATQFDWAFLFFYVKFPALELVDVADDNEAMLEADLTVRLADDTYFYVYGRNENLMNVLKQQYPEAEFKLSKFSGLDIPY